MKKILFIIGFLSQLSVSQEVELRWAEKIPTKSQVSILGGKNGNYYTTYVDRKDKIFARSYDQFLNLKSEKEINFNLSDKRYTYDGAYFLNTGIVHFIEDFERKTDRAFLYTGYSDFNLQTQDKLHVVNEVEDIDKISYFGSRRISPDSTKILVYHEQQNKRKEPNILMYKVYNSTFTNVISEGGASLPIKAKNYNTEDFRVDNNGNVYVIAKITKERSEREKNMSEYYYKLIVFGKDKQIKEFDFDYPDNDISYIDILPGANNTFFCTGFLNNLKGSNKKKMISDEMFFAVLDCNSLELKSSKMIKVDGLYPEEFKNREDYIPYKIREIYQKSDGGYSIVAEQYTYYVVQSKYGSYTVHIYCDISVIQTDKNSNVLSVSRIPKYQKQAGNPSITCTFKNDRTYVIYEDLIKNLEAENDEQTKRSTTSLFSSKSKNALFLLTIESDGKFKKEILYDYKESKIQPYILGSKQISKGEILLNANDQIGLFKIK
ncbi:hypothetical protein [Flavobacterium oreochromis]|uniref:Uncharacterized protein n=1 Tax=Flavobacterium columnare TaxID=996 RepID=A0A246G8F2_9FLAO|nr:hypothetical protein [Flavobacterium oreochromis]OWP75170.1 hypothetical protein BWK62_12580 [Flavobacterium oreochromis]